MKVMVTGARGQLGQDVVKELTRLGITPLPVDVEDFDLTDPQAVERAVAEAAPDAIIHCAAYTAVDKAETEPARCCEINGSGTLNLARAAQKIKAKLCYISTDYVFSGEGETPFEPDDPKRPQNVYGLSKLQGEEAVQGTLTRFFIVRTAWVFGLNGANFVRTMLRLGQERHSVRVVCDQIGSPTYTVDLAAFLCQLIQTDRYGAYHATNEGFCAWSDFAAEIFRQAKLSCRAEPIPSSEYPTPAKRPKNSRLSKDCLDQNGFPRLPAWQDALARYLAEMRQAGQL